LSRRVRMPTADDLFRPTVVPDVEDVEDVEEAADTQDADAAGDVDRVLVIEPDPEPAERPSGPRTTSGRVRHDEKMTVYVTADELLDLEHARLSLRRSGLAVDRGRLVREAVAIVLADLAANGDHSAIVQRLLKA
jgi:hypothetical protein